MTRRAIKRFIMSKLTPRLHVIDIPKAKAAVLRASREGVVSQLGSPGKQRSRKRLTQREESDDGTAQYEEDGIDLGAHDRKKRDDADRQRQPAGYRGLPERDEARYR
jgi:hypothetical protein